MEDLFVSSIRNQLVERKSKLERTLSVLQNTDVLYGLLKEVDKALERIDKGVYGICEVCHDSIEPDRLLIDPLMTVCLDHLSMEQQRALEIDLQDAGRIQRGLLPKNNSRFEGWEFSYHYFPAGVVSGDFCDLIPAADGSMIFVIGDVSGKGIAASLMMTHLHAMIHSLVSFDLPINEIIQKTNRLFCESTIASNYATMIAGKAMPDGTLEICIAGHNPPFLLTGEKVIHINGKGIPVGLFSDAYYEVEKYKLRKNDTLFLYTDGLVEASVNGMEYGTDRIKRNLGFLHGISSDEILNIVMQDQRTFLNSAASADDVTVAVIKKL